MSSYFGPQQGLNFIRNAQTSAYTVVNGDKGKLVALAGGALYTVTLNAASGYDSNFSVAITNEDTGRAKTIAPNGLTSFFLWPSQTITIVNDNNAWIVIGQQRYKHQGQTIFVDPVNGSSSNDGLASGSGAMDSLAHAVSLALQNFDPQGSTVSITLANGTYTETLTISGVLASGFLFSIGGSTGQGASVLWHGAIAVKDFIAVQFNEITFGSNANPCISVDQSGIIDVQGTCVFASTTGAHMAAANGGDINVNASYSITGSASYHYFAQNGGRINVNSSITVTLTGTPAFTQFVYGSSSGVINVGGSTSFSGAATGPRFLIFNGAILNTATVDPDTLFPGSTNGIYGSLPNDGGNLAGGGFGALQMIGYATGVNFNSANTDTAVKINIPKGFSKITNVALHIYGASASLTTATCGIFTATGGGGTAILPAGTAITVSASADATANNAELIQPNGNNGITYAISAGTTWQFRVGTAEGSAATGNVAIFARPLP